MPTDSLSGHPRAVPPFHRPLPSRECLACIQSAIRKANSTLRDQNGTNQPCLRQAPQGVVPRVDLAAELAAARRCFQRRLHEALLASGIDTSRPVELQAASNDGPPAVVGEHPDKEAIEALFEQDPGLIGDLHRAGSLARMIRAGEDADEFQAAFRANPESAVARYAHLFSSRYVATMSLADGRLDVTTERIAA